MSVTKERDSNLELYRIIVMLSIVAHHYVVNSGLLEIMSNNPTSFRNMFFYLFGAWGKVGINCFVLITGYYMCKSAITWRKFLKLLLEILFYMFAVNVLLIITGVENISIFNIWNDFQLIFDVSNCFPSCFLFFYLSIPFFNILIKNLTRKQHLHLIGLCLIIYTGIGTLLLGKVKINYIVWFSVLYFISSYIRLYNPMTKMRWGAILVGTGFLSVATIVIILYFGTIIGRYLPQYHFINDSYKILAVALSISMFMFFKGLHVSPSYTINRIAQSCFGVLLIHTNSDAMRQWLWKEFVNVEGLYNTDHYVVYSILIVLGVYMVCTIIDQLRIAIFEKPLFKQLDRIPIINYGRIFTE